MYEYEKLAVTIKNSSRVYEIKLPLQCNVTRKAFLIYNVMW